MATFKIRIMEICGTHTHAIAKLGIRNLLSSNIEFISGPGCPVCVSDESYIDSCISLLENPDVIIATFGDMLRVKGSKKSLQDIKSEGRRIKVIYCPEEVIALAKENITKDIIFASVGFETTAPTIALVIKMAKSMNIRNLFFLTSLKRMEPIINLIMDHPNVKVDGVICPGHVAVITGVSPFVDITYKYGIPAVISGFEAMDILEGVYILVKQIKGYNPTQFVNNYSRYVNKKGNQKAIEVINQVFQVSNAVWRGIGTISDSGLVLKKEYKQWDATQKWNINKVGDRVKVDCQCTEILMGIKTPNECIKFGTSCTPNHPLGPCMISGEGTCAAYYYYRGDKAWIGM